MLLSYHEAGADVMGLGMAWPLNGHKTVLPLALVGLPVEEGEDGAKTIADIACWSIPFFSSLPTRGY